MWIERDLTDVNDIVIQVYDTCPPGGGEELIATDDSYAPRKRIHLLEDEIGGRCLEMRAYAYDVPSNGKIVYSADYYHSGAIWDH